MFCLFLLTTGLTPKTGRSARLELTGCGFLPGLKIHEVEERLTGCNKGSMGAACGDDGDLGASN